MHYSLNIQNILEYIVGKTISCQPSDCVWSEWDVPKCSASCGEGTRIRSREILRKDLCNGKECDGQFSITEKCKIATCSSISTNITTNQSLTPSTQRIIYMFEYFFYIL